jgi:NAD(P)-dependent dehydrogenase (short-subunit alcohol dehydrogenase family)
MTGRVEGKVAFITGAARGQGRSHAVRLAEEGADIVAVDILEQIESNPYPLSTPEDLAETVRLVEKTGRRIVALKGDVRDRVGLGGRSERASPSSVENPAMGPGSAGYGWSKRILIQYTEQLALQLAPEFIRVNCIHPTNVNTHLLHNDGLYSVIRPDLEKPTREDVLPGFTHFQAMPIPYVEPVDISNAVLFFASDESCYVTGQQLRVDAGSLLKFPNGPTG